MLAQKSQPHIPCREKPAIENDMLNIYNCPDCGCEKLDLVHTGKPNHGGTDIYGTIHCTVCGSEYSIQGGIPRFVSLDNYSDSFGYQWNLHRKSQLDSHTGLPISSNRLFEVTGWSPEKLKGNTVLEAGSGAGRFTEALLKAGASVVSFDFSSAVDANLSNQNPDSKLTLFQGDLLKIPLRKRSFPRVLCLGVLQHASDPARAFRNLSLLVAPGGEIIIDIYRKNLVSMLQWKYLLRPITKRIDKELLYKLISNTVPPLLPLAVFFKKIGGRAGGRLLPIADYSNLGLTRELNKEWAILDTFDMYSPAYDYPQSIETVTQWFNEAGMQDITVKYGPNGITGKGTYPARAV